MAVSTIKFSQFLNSGNLAPNEITVGLNGGSNAFFNNPWTFLPPGNTAARPPIDASMYYLLRLNTDLSLYEYYNPTTGLWEQLTVSVIPPSFTWIEVTSSPVLVAASFGYIVNSSTLIQLDLPATSVVGDVFSVVNMNTGGFKIAQGAGQFLNIDPVSSTTGTSGYVASTSTFNSINWVCNIANTSWTAAGAPQGILSIN